MSLRAITSPPAGTAPSTLADRFWSLAPSGRRRDEEAVEAVDALLRILERLRGGDSPYSLAALLQEQAARGDHAYSSPEQIATTAVTERSLVFSVGVLLFERLCHRHPFGADKKPLELVRVRRAELGSSVNYLPRLPPALRAILTRALSPLPEERFETVADFAAALAMFSAHEPRQPRLPGAPPVQAAPGLTAVSGSLRARPVSEWERLSTDAESDELSAPDLREQLRAEAGTPRRFPRASKAPEPAAPAPLELEHTAPTLRRGVPKGLWLALGGAAVATAFAAGLYVARPAEAPAVAPAPPPPVAEPAPAPAPEPEPAPAVFSPDDIAEATAAAIAGCFPAGTPAPGPFGLSLYYPRHDTVVHKIYFAENSVLTAAQKACVQRSAASIAAAAPPGAPTTVELNMAARSGTVVGHVARVLEQ